MECGHYGPKNGAGATPGSQGAGDQESIGQKIPRYLDPEEFRQPGKGGHGWGELLDYWALIEADLHQFYGLDLWHPNSYRAIAWHYLRSRVEQLFGIPPTILYRPTADGFRRVLVPATRIGLQLEPPDEGDDDQKG